MTASWLVNGRPVSQADLDRQLSDLRQSLHGQGTVLAHASDRHASIASLAYARAEGLRLVVAPAEWSRSQVSACGSQYGAGVEIRSDAASGALSAETLAAAADVAADPGLVLFTSGTTGAPKAIGHSWESIAASGSFVDARLEGATWYLAYELGTFAGLQVYFSALHGHGRLVVPAPAMTSRTHAEYIAGNAIDAISATPTWWRVLLTSWPSGLPQPQLRQATMGGEIVDQSILDLVDRHFRPERLTHIYATSETGTAIVVSDRRAGFPAALLDADRRVRLRVVDGVLQVQSPYRMRGYVGGDASVDEAWFDTGDLVEVTGDRCYFRGRRDQRLNIGGAKVSAEEVEAEIESEPNVQACFVYGKASPIVGTLLAADIVPREGDSVDIASLRARLSNRLPAYKVPRHIRIVQNIEVMPSGKKRRR